MVYEEIVIGLFEIHCIYDSENNFSEVKIYYKSLNKLKLYHYKCWNTWKTKDDMKIYALDYLKNDKDETISKWLETFSI